MNRELSAPEKMLIEASRYMGLQEFYGAEDNPVILDMLSTDAKIPLTS